MGNVLKIKSRQTGATGAPGSLARAELAYNEQDNTLYIGHGANDPDTDANRDKKAIAGVGAFVDLASSQTLTNKDLTATTNSFTAASATQAGVVELATDTEAITGTATTKAVTPGNLGAWTGNTAITSVGTIATGIWSGTALVAGKLPKLNGITQPDGDMNFNGQTLTNIDTPTGDTDAATKGYVDSKVQGLDVKESVRLATAADLPACTYAQPVATTGVGATLTANANGALTVDGVAVAINDRILVQHQGTGTETHAHNGVYRVSTLGTGSAAWVLTRATDFDENDEISSAAFVFVEAGTANPDSGFVCTTDGAITFSSSTFSGVGWTQFSGAGSVTAGDGIAQSGTTLSADLKSNGGLEIQSGEIALNIGSSAITGTLAAGDGGTGAATHTSNGVLYGAGASSVGATAAGANNAILYSNSGTPAWTTSPDGLTIDGGTF